MNKYYSIHIKELSLVGSIGLRNLMFDGSQVVIDCPCYSAPE